MLTGQIRNQVDAVWNTFWTGGVANPISVIEQISYLLFIRRLDEVHTNAERKANIIGKPIENPIFLPKQNALRWSVFKDKDPQTMFELVRDKVFPFIKNIHGEESAFAQHMKDAIFMIPKPGLLAQVVDMIEQIPMQDRDTKGDLYEYLLSKLSQSGVNGQFRTPRHIIKMMVEMLKPVLSSVDSKKSDLICDPAAGTCGFLMAAEEYVREHYKDALLKKPNADHFHKKMFTGFDFDTSMLRIGAMNMMLHGIEHPRVEYRDSLSDAGGNKIEEAYTLILANPPFKGSVAFDELAPDLLHALGKTVKKVGVRTKKPSEKTELLFLALILRLLKKGGRAAVIVPDGVLFGSTQSHRTIRKKLVEDQCLQAVISMPTGVFKPYAGVSTAVLLFTKTNSGGTDNVWYYDMKADGYSLDDKRTPLNIDGEKIQHEKNNIPDILTRWNNLLEERKRKHTDQSFFVTKSDIVKEGYDLSINRYKKIVHEKIQSDSPKNIIARIKRLQQQMEQGLIELEMLL
ncbi:MAG TPA: class I SAM-dependent DNA methyltransferase [Gammaproteobacteria bacterium]|nr:class I SAM-dependent DNA methyltransferase [Gammaproteobacteria bacterium]